MPYQIGYKWPDERKTQVHELETAKEAYGFVYGIIRSDARLESIRAPEGRGMHESELEQLAIAEGWIPPF